MSIDEYYRLLDASRVRALYFDPAWLEFDESTPDIDYASEIIRLRAELAEYPEYTEYTEQPTESHRMIIRLMSIISPGDESIDRADGCMKRGDGPEFEMVMGEMMAKLEMIIPPLRTMDDLPGVSAIMEVYMTVDTVGTREGCESYCKSLRCMSRFPVQWRMDDIDYRMLRWMVQSTPDWNRLMAVIVHYITISYGDLGIFHGYVEMLGVLTVSRTNMHRTEDMLNRVARLIDMKRAMGYIGAPLSDLDRACNHAISYLASTGFATKPNPYYTPMVTYIEHRMWTHLEGAYRISGQPELIMQHDPDRYTDAARHSTIPPFVIADHIIL